MVQQQKHVQKKKQQQRKTKKNKHGMDCVIRLVDDAYVHFEMCTMWLQIANNLSNETENNTIYVVDIIITF